MEGYTKIEGKVIRVYRRGLNRSYLVQEGEKKTWYNQEDVLDGQSGLYINTEAYNKKNKHNVT